MFYSQRSLSRLFLILCVLPFFSYANEQTTSEVSRASDQWLASMVSKNIQEQSSLSLASLEGESNAFIHQCVNAISGVFCDFAVDLISHGADPLKIERCYSGSIYNNGNLCDGWSLNHKGFLHRETTSKPDWYHVVNIHVQQELGHFLGFNASKGSKKEVKNERNFNLMREYMQGVTNTSHGIISGQTNIKNLRLQINVEKTSFYLKSGSGSVKYYRLHTHARHRIYQLEKEKKPNGNILEYFFQDPSECTKHPVNHYSLDLKNSQGTLLHSIKVPKNKFFNDTPTEFVTEDGRFVKYSFRDPGRRLLLDKVERSDGPSESFTYELINTETDQQNARQSYFLRRYWLTKKERPEGRYLKLDYYDYGKNYLSYRVIGLDDRFDPRIDRVKCLYAPAGNDETPVRIYEFVYDLDIIKNNSEIQEVGKGITTVYDAYENRTDYGFNADHRLTSISKYDDNNTVFTCEQLYWGRNRSKNETNLITKTLKSRGEMKFIVHYKYDNRGNVIEQLTYGNLTGNNQISPEVDKYGDPIENGCETYSKRFIYSDDGYNLLLEETDGDQVTRYSYYPGSNQLKSKLQGSASQWMRRWFYTYDKGAALLKEIVDDGSNEDESDLTGVTERLITVYTPKSTYPVGLPEVIEQKCLDLSTGTEILIHKINRHYTPQGWIAREEHFDQLNNFAYANIFVQENFFL